MKLFDNTLNDLDSIVNKRTAAYQKYDPLVKALNETKAMSATGLAVAKDDKVLAKVNYSEIQSLFGVHKFSFMEPKIGPHPDFAHLQHNQYLNHYAVSMFLDIKGSTKLSKKYDLLQIRQIKDTILSLAIQACSFFGGHIQRLQGDGIFVYFVRKDMHHLDAIINSVNAASLMAFFMEYKLPHFFKKDDIEAPKVRIGIDYGDENQTLWSYYGLPFCNELTTTSLHTDLAAKLQAKAPSNGLVIGQNLVDGLDLQEHLAKCDPNEKFIFDTYKKYDFNWQTYLQTFDFIRRDGQSNLTIQEPTQRLQCEIAEAGSDNFYVYNQNLYSIPKGYQIRFTLIENGHPYVLKPQFKEKITWKIKNTGKEATKAQKLEEEVNKGFNSNTCTVNAEFLGHHDMHCKITREAVSMTNTNLRFPVYVR